MRDIRHAEHPMAFCNHVTFLSFSSIPHTAVFGLHICALDGMLRIRWHSLEYRGRSVGSLHTSPEFGWFFGSNLMAIKVEIGGIWALLIASPGLLNYIKVRILGSFFFRTYALHVSMAWVEGVTGARGSTRCL